MALITKKFLKDSIRIITGTDTLDAQNDLKIVCNAGAGTFDINLPPGVEGLTFIVNVASSNVGVFSFVPDGGDLIDANVTSNFSSNLPTPLTFISGTWYNV